MSDTWLLYVPEDPFHSPDRDAAERTRVLLQKLLPDAEAVEYRYEDSVVFIDAGQNWEGVTCPACGEDAEAWWGDMMDAAFEQGFEDLTCTAGCCGARVALNELNYGWPVAFGRFVLKAMNPNSAGLAAQIQEIEQTLGCGVHEICRRV